MTNSTPPENHPPTTSRNLWLILFSRPVLGTLLVLLIFLGAGGWRLWIFINDELAPLVEQNLRQLLNRPVNLGPVTSFSLTHLRFGSSSIPPYTRRDQKLVVQDRDALTVRAVDVRFDPLALLLNRRLELDVILVQPNLYVDQARDGSWLATPITPPKGEGPLQIDLQALRIRQGQAIAVPFGTPPRKLVALNGAVLLQDNNQRLPFNLSGGIATGGQFKLDGVWTAPQQRLVAKVQAEKLALGAIADLVPQVPLQAKAGQLSANLQVEYQPQKPLQLAGQAQVQGATLVVPDRFLLQSLRPQSRTFTQVNGTATFKERSPLVDFDLRGQLTTGGKLQAKGQASLAQQEAQFLLTVENLPATVLDGAFQVPINVQTGRVDGKLNLRLGLNQELPQIQGTAQLQQVTARIAEIPQPFRQVTGQVRFLRPGITIQLEDIRGLYGQVPLQGQGLISLERGYDLRATTAVVPVATALETLEVEPPFPISGEVQAENLRVTGAIETPVLTGTVTAPGTPVLDQVPFESLSAQFRLDIPPEAGLQLRVTDIQATPTIGGTITGQARYNFETNEGLEANFTATGVPGNAIAQLYNSDPGFPIGPVAAQARIAGLPENLVTTVQFQAPQAEYPTTGTSIWQQDEILLRDVVSQFAGGELLTNGRIADEQFRGTVIPTGLQLQQFSPDLRGQLSGRLAVTGPIANFGPETLQAEGRVRFSQGIAVVEQPLTARVRWNGDNLLVQSATAPGFSASGVIGVEFPQPTAPQITALNLMVNAQDYPLRSLPPLGPTEVEVAGLANLQGQLTGTLEDLNLNAALRVNDLAVAQVRFAPVLKGRLNYGSLAGLNLNLTGGGDRIAANLGPDLQPESFELQRGEAIAQGQRQGDLFLVGLQQFPLRTLNLPAGEFGTVSGSASGDFTYNLATNNLTGQVQIAQPGIGRLIGKSFSGQIRFAEGIATLTDGELIGGDSQYRIDARLQSGTAPRFAGTIQVDRGDLQDLVTALNAFELAEGVEAPALGSAADLQLESVGLPTAPLLSQLRRFSEIETLLQQQIAARQQEQPLPNLTDLAGALQGRINFSGSPQTGLQASFNLQGEQINWGEYQIDQLVASGKLQDETLTLAPLRLTADGTLIAFNGQVGGENQSGQLVLTDVPVNILSRFVELPFEAEGQLNGTAQLSGSLTNPALQGQLTVAAARLNQTPVETAQATFNYDDARLTFDSTAVIQGPEPIRISGSLPYALPFASVEPQSDQIRLTATVQDQGLALLNLLTDQVAWVEGQGRVQVEVTGTLEQPTVQGLATVQQATLKTPALTNPLTDVTGILRFDRDRLVVPKLTAQYNQRPILAEGGLAIAEPVPLAGIAPLTVSFNDVNLQIENLYAGEADGKLVVTGSLLKPELGGTLALANGQVILANRAEAAAETTATTEPTVAETPASPVAFNALRVSLNDVRVTSRPLLNFVTYGDLTVGGTLDNPAPSGVVRFRRGDVNLFTNRFRLDRDKSNYALFDPAQGLDPFLSLNMVTTVTEVTGGGFSPRLNPTAFSSPGGPLNEFNDVPAGAIGTLESIRVQAKVEGRASQLATNPTNVIELNSSPPRSEGEILALLGGGFVTPLAQGNVQLAAASFATSAFLNTLQGFLDDALDNRAQFRVFPTLIPNDRNESVLGLGAEVGYDLTPQISVSVLQVLTGVEEPTRFNVSYQLNNRLRLRTAVGTNGEAVGIVEYRTRF